MTQEKHVVVKGPNFWGMMVSIGRDLNDSGTNSAVTFSTRDEVEFLGKCVKVIRVIVNSMERPEKESGRWQITGVAYNWNHKAEVLIEFNFNTRKGKLILNYN